MENVLLMCIDNDDDDDNFMKSVFCVLCCVTVWHVEKSVRMYGVYTVQCTRMIILPTANCCFTCISHDNKKIQERWQ